MSTSPLETLQQGLSPLSALLKTRSGAGLARSSQGVHRVSVHIPDPVGMGILLHGMQTLVDLNCFARGDSPFDPIMVTAV